MANVQRYNGDANGVVNVDISLGENGINGVGGVTSNGKIISTGIGKHPTAFKITANVSLDTEMGVGEAVEAMLRTVQVASTTIMYQVNGPQLSVLCEATGFDDANLTTALNSLSSNIAGVNIKPVTVSSTEGFRLA